jgi:hypothetical protein
MSLKIEKEKILIVEGTDEERIFNVLIGKHLNNSDIQILPIGGKTQLINKLRILCSVSEFNKVRSLGIVRDADEDFNGAFESVCDSLRANSLSIPSGPFIKTNSTPSISVFITPNNSSNGAIENIFWEVINQTNISSCITNYFQCILTNTGSNPRSIYKGYMHAYLSANIDNPSLRFGESAENGLWDFNDNCFNLIKSFIANI